MQITDDSPPVLTALDRPNSYIGRSVPRPNLARLTQGRGLYVSDVTLPRMTHVAFVRSPHAHATIKSIATDAAKKSSGVIAVVTGPELAKVMTPWVGVLTHLKGLKSAPQSPIAVGVASAGAVRVGLAVGARNQTRTRMAGFSAITGGIAIMLVGAAVFALFPRAVARLLTDQGNVITAAVPVLLVAAVFQLSDGLQAIGAGILRGAGDTTFPLAANLVGHWLIGLPIALYLGFHRNMGIVGLWWGLCAGLTAVAILLLFRFNRLSKTAIVPILRRA